MDVDAPRGLLRFFDKLEDPRMDRTKRHQLQDILAIAICAVICGADAWTDVEKFGKAKLEWFKTFLELPNGIPSHDTFGRLFARLDPDQFERCFLDWMTTLAQATAGRLLALDGKTLRRSFDTAASRKAIHMVSAWCETNHLVLGQLATEAKSNEITALPKLLALLDVTGAVVTIDAMGCQKAIAGQIVEQGGDYILQVKDNQKTLHEDLQLLFDEGIRDDCLGVAYCFAEDVCGGHGRVETRRIWTSSEVGWLAQRGQWTGVGSVVCVERTREVSAETSRERHYYISSLDGRDAKTMLNKIRGHWGVENRLHWSLDVSFREDESRVRVGYGAENFSRLRRTALNLLRRETSVQGGIRAKRLLAGWDNDYLLKVLAAGD